MLEGAKASEYDLKKADSTRDALQVNDAFDDGTHDAIDMDDL